VYLDEKIQIIASMAPSSTMGRHQLSTRFTANVRILAIDYPSLSELQIVYEKYMNVVFENKTLIHS
jgi:dynein heavy chain 2